MIDFKLDDDLKALRDGLEQIALTLMRPYTRDVDEHEHSDPKQYIDTMYEMMKNVGGASASPITGGEERDVQVDVQAAKPKQTERSSSRPRRANLQALVFVEQLAWGDCGMYLSTPMALLGGAAVGATGTPEQKQRFLARFSEGKPKWAAMANTEPGTGSDVASIQTTAKLEGDEWVLNGEKIFVTAGKRALVDSEGFVVVFATIDRSAGRAGIKPFVVEAGTPGMTVAKVEKKHGIRCSDTAVITFEDCRIPKDNLLGKPEVEVSESNTGFKGAMATFDATRPPVAASACGVGRAAVDHVRERLAQAGIKPRYGVSPNKLTARERDFMMMEAKLRASWLLTLRAGWVADTGQPNSLEASMAKCRAGRDNVWICQKAVELLGPEGYFRENLVEKWMRDAKIGDIYEGTQNVQKLVVARRIFGYSRDDLN